MTSQLRFENKVVIVTNSGEGLGQLCATAFASRGAKVVVHDQNAEAADKVAKQIKAKGGNAVANSDSTDSADKIVKAALSAYGRVDIVINNPVGIPKDISFHKMTKQDWDLAIKLQMRAAFSVSHAAWNLMRDQGFGRIVNFSSSAGLYGNFGQANSSAAKLAVHGLTLSLAKEGERKNILVNTVATFSTTRMIEGVLNDDILAGLKGDYIVPLVVYLSHENCNETGSLFEAAGGYISKYRWNRSDGFVFDLPFTPETVRDEWEKIGDFSQNDAPTGMNDTFPKIMGNAEKLKAKEAQMAAQVQAKPLQTSEAPAGGSTLKTDNTFHLMNAFLATGDGKDIIAKLGSVFGFEITPKKGEPPARVWTIDLKNGNGLVKLGKPENPDATFTMTDDDFDLVTQGKLNAQTAFVQGKMKIKGNMKKASAFTTDLFPKPTPENLAKYLGKSVQGTAASSTTSSTTTTATTNQAPAGGSTLKTDNTFQLMNAYLATGAGKDVVTKLSSVFGFEITPKKGEPPARVWTIDLKNGNGLVKLGKPENPDATFTMTDDDFDLVTQGKLNAQTAFVQGKMKIKGNMKKASAFTADLFPRPTPENFAKYLTPKPKL